MGEIYKIDNFGRIYTWREFYGKYSSLVYEVIDIQVLWGDLQEIDLEGLSREEVQKKMDYVYKGNTTELVPGDIITDDLYKSDMAVVTEVLPNGEILVRDLTSSMCRIWKGDYLRLASTLFTTPSSTLFVKDPTKMLKLAPRKPINDNS